MPYKVLTFDQKIEQLLTSGNGYKEMAAREPSLPLRNHCQYWADFMMDLANDIRLLRDIQSDDHQSFNTIIKSLINKNVIIEVCDNSSYEEIEKKVKEVLLKAVKEVQHV